MLILRRLAEGRSVDDILTEYPHLTRAQVEAATRHLRESRQLSYLAPLSNIEICVLRRSSEYGSQTQGSSALYGPNP